MLNRLSGSAQALSAALTAAKVAPALQCAAVQVSAACGMTTLTYLRKE
jgi:hypothetical protein